MGSASALHVGNRDGLKSIRQCTYSKKLDMETLVCTRGRNFPLSLLAERTRCPRCGSRKIRIVYDPTGESWAVAAFNAAKGRWRASVAG